MLCRSWGFLSGRRSTDLSFFLSEDGVTFSIITVDTFIKHAVPLGLVVVIYLLVTFGRKRVRRRQWNIGSVPCGIPRPSRRVSENPYIQCFLQISLLYPLFCQEHSFISVVGDH